MHLQHFREWQLGCKICGTCYLLLLDVIFHNNITDLKESRHFPIFSIFFPHRNEMQCSLLFSVLQENHPNDHDCGKQIVASLAEHLIRLQSDFIHCLTSLLRDSLPSHEIAINSPPPLKLILRHSKRALNTVQNPAQLSSGDRSMPAPWKPFPGMLPAASFNSL